MPFPEDDDSPHYEVVDITPQMAEEMLARNTHNRNLRHRVVSSYAADMAAGAWAEDGQSIKFAKDGTLLDGQHRLAAVAESGATVRMLVVRNLPLDAQENMDTQAKRSFSDVLKLRGEDNYIPLAAAVRRVHLWELGIRRPGGNTTPTVRQLLATLDKYPWLRDTVRATSTARAQLPIHGSIISLAHWLFVQIDPEDCEFFFARLVDGVGLADGDPIHVLRRTVIREMTAGTKLTETVVLAYVIKAWNAYREGRKIGLLKFRVGGAKPEPFPEPK
jgi:hypothetical protein